MPTVNFRFAKSAGEWVEVDAKPGRSLMIAAIDAGIDGIAADCGGSLTCATCHVYVAPEWVERLPPPDDEEVAMLDFVAAERKPESRLSCQIRIDDSLDGLTVQLPPNQY